MEPISQSILSSLSAWAQGMLTPMLSLGISAVYLFTSPRTEPLAKRLLASSHGAMISVLYMAAMSIFWANMATPKYGTPFALLLLLPLLLIAVSFFLYRGPKSVHALQLLNLLCLGWTFFIGSMAVTGRWL